MHQRDRIHNDDICKRLGVSSVEEKFLQHHLNGLDITNEGL
jgi:hypothetical protein